MKFKSLVLKKYMLFLIVGLLLTGVLLTGVYGFLKYPSYVSDAIEKVSSTISYNYGPSQCDASKKSTDLWYLECKPDNGESDTLEFIVRPEKVTYKDPQSFYLVANNKEAKIAASKDINESLLSYLMADAGTSTRNL